MKKRQETIRLSRLNLKSTIEAMGSKTYGVTFMKADNTMRNMTTRNGTTSGIKGTGKAVGAHCAVIRRQDMGLLAVAGITAKNECREVTEAEKAKTWRSIPLARVTELRGNGVIYEVVD